MHAQATTTDGQAPCLIATRRTANDARRCAKRRLRGVKGIDEAEGPALMPAQGPGQHSAAVHIRWEGRDRAPEAPFH